VRRCDLMVPRPIDRIQTHYKDTYVVQRHLTRPCVAPARVHKYHFVSLCNVTLH
jgi:hypothetical protein